METNQWSFSFKIKIYFCTLSFKRTRKRKTMLPFCGFLCEQTLKTDQGTYSSGRRTSLSFSYRSHFFCLNLDKLCNRPLRSFVADIVKSTIETPWWFIHSFFFIRLPFSLSHFFQSIIILFYIFDFVEKLVKSSSTPKIY